MKRFFSVFLIFVLCISFAVSAFAVEPDELVELTYWEWCILSVTALIINLSISV